MQTNLRGLNIKYAFCNIGYLFLIVGTMGYAYNYLSQCGFSDGVAGTVMAVTNLLGAIGGPVVGDIIDHSRTVSQKTFIQASSIIIIAASVLLLVVPKTAVLIFPLCIISFALASIVMPLLNGMAFIYDKIGGRINYGLCRGLGSGGFAVGSAVLGRMWSGLGNAALPVWVAFSAVITLVSVTTMPVVSKNVVKADGQENGQEAISLGGFFGKYHYVTIAAVAVTCIYVGHYIINNYMAKIVEMLGASNIETVQGNAMFIAAMCEIPAMFAFALLLRKFGINRIMVAATCFFALKNSITFFCTSVGMLYMASALQIGGYAVLIPGVVYFANQYVAEVDRNKGQALFTSVMTAGSLIASFVGGWLFSLTSTRFVLGVGAVASIVGVLLIFVAIHGLVGENRDKVEDEALDK